MTMYDHNALVKKFTRRHFRFGGILGQRSESYCQVSGAVFGGEMRKMKEKVKKEIKEQEKSGEKKGREKKKRKKNEKGKEKRDKEEKEGRKKEVAK